MPDPTPPTPPTPPATPWHAGIDAEILDVWQNKNLDLSDPKNVAIEVTKANKSFEKHFGVQADRLLKLPDKADDQAGWDAVWQRLGAPKEAKEYDFAGIKSGDGKDLDAKFTDTLRSTFAKSHLPKDAATDVTKAVVKHLDDVKAEQAAAYEATLTAEKAKLAQNWPADKFNYNLEVAKKGAASLGISPEAVAAMEKVDGYSKVMEAMRQIGELGREDRFVPGKDAPGNNVNTVAGAQSRLNELMADVEWGRRLTKGDAAAVREFNSLTGIIAAAA